MDAHQTSVYAVVIISSIIIGIIILYFIISIIHHQRRTHTMYKKALQAEINTLEKERSRMAADMHDELGPVLSAIKFKVGSIDLHSAEDEETVEGVYEYIDSLVKRIREISNDLMPNVLTYKGVIIALDNFIRHMSKPEQLQINFAYQDIPELTEFQSIHIYRIVLEIIHNTIKHANATELRIECKGEDHSLLLQTMDNGHGFDYYTITRKTKQRGLRNIISRSQMLGATLLTEISPGKGTKYIIRIPYVSPTTTNQMTV